MIGESDQLYPADGARQRTIRAIADKEPRVIELLEDVRRQVKAAIDDRTARGYFDADVAVEFGTLTSSARRFLMAALRRILESDGYGVEYVLTGDDADGLDDFVTCRGADVAVSWYPDDGAEAPAGGAA